MSAGLEHSQREVKVALDENGNHGISLFGPEVNVGDIAECALSIGFTDGSNAFGGGKVMIRVSVGEVQVDPESVFDIKHQYVFDSKSLFTLPRGVKTVTAAWAELPTQIADADKLLMTIGLSEPA